MDIHDFELGAWKLLTGYDRLRQTLIGVDDFASRLAPYIQQGLDAIAADIPNATIDAALQAEKPEVLAVLDIEYGLTQPMQRFSEAHRMLGISGERFRARSGMGIVRLRSRITRGEGKRQ